ncbi:MAG: RidA family protein [Pseudomonadota bacterium]|nr:MAG: RidA family protein [Sphingomonadales bacterium]
MNQLPPPLSKTRRAGDLLFISGQLPRAADGSIVPGGIIEQTRQALTNLKGIVEGEGGNMADIVKTTVWLTDAGMMGDFNSVYREFFAEPFPTRSTIVSGLVAAADVEVEAVAWLPAK